MCSVTQLCLTLCKPLDCSWPGSSVHGILQATIPKWVAIPSSRGSSQPRSQIQVSFSSYLCANWEALRAQFYFVSFYSGLSPLSNLSALCCEDHQPKKEQAGTEALLFSSSHCGGAMLGLSFLIFKVEMFVTYLFGVVCSVWIFCWWW